MNRDIIVKGLQYDGIIDLFVLLLLEEEADERTLILNDIEELLRHIEEL